MKQLYSFIVISLLFYTSSLLGQEMNNLSPYKVRDLNFSKDYIEKFNTPESWKKCEQIFETWRKEKRDHTSATQEEEILLSYCDEIKEDPWDIHGVACSWYCGGGQDSLSSSSALPPYKGNDYKANNAHDLSYKTAWVEGVKGHGVGEYLDYHIKAKNPRITEIIVVNGYVKNETAWRNNSRVKKLKVYVDDKPYAILHLKDSRSEQHFKVPPLGTNRDKFTFDQMKKMPDWKMRFEILEVYPGDKYDDTVITEIYFDGIDVHCLAAGSSILMADGSSKSIENLETGDQVLSVNLNSNKLESATVLELASPQHHDLIKISFNDGSSLTCTADHPILSSEGQWASVDPEKTRSAYRYDQVGLLQVGSSVSSNHSNRLIITEIQMLPQVQTTYTIVRLNRNQNFIANGIVVGTEPLRETHKTIGK